MDPKRRRGEGRGKFARPRHAAGRWALLRHTPNSLTTEARATAFADQLLERWGVIFRDLLAREMLAPPWRDLLPVLRRKEAQGEIRGGRFVSGFTGEQFARPEALDLLRAIRRSEASTEENQNISNADPLNLAGIILPGPRVSTLLQRHATISGFRRLMQGKPEACPTYGKPPACPVRTAGHGPAPLLTHNAKLQSDLPSMPAGPAPGLPEMRSRRKAPPPCRMSLDPSRSRPPATVR